MRAYGFATIAALALSAAAAPAPDGEGHWNGADYTNPGESNNTCCLDDSHAYKVAENFGQLISAYTNSAAQAYLTTNFTDYSDSVNELINNGCTGPQALGTATFNSLAAFEAGQGSQPNVTFNILNVWYVARRHEIDHR
jgi:hypothetical protein